MPQCKDRLRYRWLEFHLDLTTSARLRSAATPARRPRPKKRRSRKQNDRRIEAFNLLFALGLVPTKSRMNDPQGLLLNRMHVMDGDCPKSEVIGEKAPEIDLSPRSAPLANTGSTTTTTTTADTTADLTIIANKDVSILKQQQQSITEADNNNTIRSVLRSNDNAKQERINSAISNNKDEVKSSLENSGANNQVVNEKVDSNSGNSEEDKMGVNSVLVNGNSESSVHGDSDMTKCVDDEDDMLVEEDDEEMDEEIDIDKNREDDLLEETADSNRQLKGKVKNGECDDDKNINENGVQGDEDEDGSNSCSAGKQDQQQIGIDLKIKKEDAADVDMNDVNKSEANNSIKNSVIDPNIKIKEDNSNINSNNGVCSEEEDRHNVSSSHTNSIQNRKRPLLERNEHADGEVDNEVEGEPEGEGSSSESESGTKRQRVEVEAEDERERLVREYVERCTQSVEEMSRNADKLQREIGALGELARAKELEWNSILRLRKLKEEMLERLLRRRRQAMMLADNGLTQEWATDYTKPKMNKNPNNQLMMVPVVSSSPGNLPPSLSSGVNSRPLLSSPDTTRMSARGQRPILPKPSLGHSQSSSMNHNSNHSLAFDQQNTVIGEGRQGPILDVKSIIADYSGDRSRHPENVPRRGRRMKSPLVSSTRITGSPALMSMANMALCSGAHIRNTSQDCSSAQENSRPSSTESTRSVHQTELPAPGLSFKDVLVQFAKMSQPPPPVSAPIKQPPPPPPPYPEVTLHPVPAPQSPPPTHSSLLHGILTKTTAAATPSSTSTASHPNHRPTTFSPTLARLLTAPERERTTPTMSSQFRPPTNRVSISDLLTSSKKTRNEITITPVSSQLPVKSKEEVVLLDDDEETDSTDRLVIDESGDREREGGGGNGDVTSEDVPECQGCHQRAAQFVCAGCGNQWYCSRECQVTAWEDHSEMCSG